MELELLRFQKLVFVAEVASVPISVSQLGRDLLSSALLLVLLQKLDDVSVLG